MIYITSFAANRGEEMEAKAWMLRRPESLPTSASGGHQGRIVGSEDLYVVWQREGKIELRNHSLTVGPTENVIGRSSPQSGGDSA